MGVSSDVEGATSSHHRAGSGAHRGEHHPLLHAPPEVEDTRLVLPNRPCAATVQSSLNGVSILVTAPVCEFTLAEARAGVSIPYEVHVTEAIEVNPPPKRQWVN